MKRFRWPSAAILFIIVSSLLPLAFAGAAQADSGKGNLKELTDAADSILVGTVTDRHSYWNDAHTQIYTSAVFSVEDRVKGEAGPDKVTITVPGGEVEGIGEFVSEMPSFDQGEQAVVFLKKLNKAQLPKAMSLPDKFPAQQFEVYQGFRGKFPIRGDKVNNLPVAEFKGRINSVLSGQALPAAQLDVAPPPVTMPYLVLPYSWPHPPAPVVSYRINENATSCTGEGAAVQNAAPTWSSAGTNFSFSYAGTTAATAYGYDGVNEIMWVNTLDTGILAVTHIFYSGSTILENDVEFNNYYNWSTSPTCPGGYYDVQSVGLHEFGHWLALNDLYNPADAAKVMYGYTSSGTTKRALTADDIAGIQSIYGAYASSDPQQLIGVASGTASTGSGGSCTNVMMQRFLATSTGSIAGFRVKASASGNVKVAIYSDSSGQPNSRLAAVSSTPVATGWNTIPITSTPVISGTYYWLAVVSDSCNIYYHSNDPSANTIWKPSTYSSWNFLDPAGSGWNTQTGYTYFIAGWSTTTPPTPTSAPTVTNSTGASNIVSTSARLNGEITSTGNENPAVTIYYGTTDGVNTPGNWANHVDLGTKGLGTFYTDVSNLTPNTLYFYRCYAINSAGSDWADTSAQFTTSVQTQRLIGVAPDTASTGGGGGCTNIMMQRFLATATGPITEFKVKVSASGNVKVAIYDDIAGSPTTRRSYNDSSMLVTSGWNTIPIPSASITSGTYYWLAVVSDSCNIYYHSNDPSANTIWKPSTYSSWAWPGSAGSGWNTQPGYTYFIAGWRTIGPLDITTTSLPNGNVSTPYSQTLQATGGIPPYYWWMPSGAPPNGLLMSASGVISGTPTTAGTSNFTVQVVDSAPASDTQALSITINPPPPDITTTSLPAGYIGTPYSQTLQATGGVPPYTWAASGMVNGLSLNASSGVISGIPTATGIWGFQVTVTDSASGSDTQALSITINGPPDIVTTSLPDGTVGGYYSKHIDVTAGIAPYTWSIYAGTLPTGLSLNSSTGDISGTPTVAGTYNFTVQVTDATPSSDTQVLAINIIPQTQRLIGVAPDTASTGSGGSCSNVMLQRFQASATGSITELKVKASASGNIKVAIYDDSSGSPTTRRSYNDSSTPVTSGWNTIAITPSVAVTAGNYYWLAVVSDSCNIYYHSNDLSANTIWKPSTYSSWAWPGSAGSGWNTQTGYTYFIAAWGTTTPPTPPNQPDLLSPGAAITFKWGAPNGATKYQLQVSTSSSFTTTVFDTDVGNNTSQEVTGLSSGTLYYWRVRAGNDGGWGNWSTTRSVIVNQVP